MTAHVGVDVEGISERCGGHKKFSRTLLLLAIATALTGGTIIWVRVVIDLRHTELFMQDWFVNYAAGVASRAGEFALLFDGNAFTDFQYRLLRHWYSTPPSLLPWFYPPLFLLLLAPLSLLSFPLSYAVFQLVTGAAALGALGWRGLRRGFAWPSALLLLSFPATASGALAGQNALLSTALLVGGMRVLDASPAFAGALLGALAYKPQLFLMVPVALIARRAWRALAFTCASAALLVLLSASVFGLQSWWLWLDLIFRGSDPAKAQWYNETFLSGYSFYVCATDAGLVPLAAKLVQVAAALVAAGAVWWTQRRGSNEEAKLGVLLVATVMATPHLQMYDLMLPGAAAILFFVRARKGIDGLDLTLFASTWMLPLLRPNLVTAGIYAVPVVFAALLVNGLRLTRSNGIEKNTLGKSVNNIAS